MRPTKDTRARSATIRRLSDRFVWGRAIGMMAFGLCCLMDGLPAAAEEIPAECTQQSDIQPGQQTTNMCLGYKLRAMEVDVKTAFARQLAVQQDANYEDAATSKMIIDAFVASQTAFDAYRAGECNSEGYMALGGSLEGQLYGECQVRLLTARLAELKMLSEGLAN